MGRQHVHHVEHQLFQNHAQAPRADFAREGQVRDRLDLGERRPNVFGLDEVARGVGPVPALLGEYHARGEPSQVHARPAATRAVQRHRDDLTGLDWLAERHDRHARDARRLPGAAGDRGRGFRVCDPRIQERRGRHNRGDCGYLSRQPE